MGRIKRSGFIFEFWVGDHPPRHVHVLKNRKLIARVELDEKLTLMEGKISRRVKKILQTLVQMGALK